MKRAVLGDKNLERSLQTKVLKDNYVTVSDPSPPKNGFEKFDRSKQFPQRGRGRRQFYVNAATVVKKPITQFEPSTQTPTEQIKRVNLTGLTDDDLFGPAFL